jgi:hypothetical protein
VPDTSSRHARVLVTPAVEALVPVPRPPFSPLAPGLALGRAVLLTVAPHGGQHTARRNAWAAMVADAQRARARRDADGALDAAQARTAATHRVGG